MRSKIEMKMLRAAGVEFAFAGRTGRIAVKVFVDRQLATACSAEYCQRISFIPRPDFRLVICDLSVTFKTRKPPAATFEFDRDDVRIAVIVSAASFGVDVDTVYDFAMHNDVHFISPEQWPACTNRPRGSAIPEPEPGSTTPRPELSEKGLD